MTPNDRNDPPILSCPGGPAVEHDAGRGLARCRCGVWFDTVADAPVFPPHRLVGDVVRFALRDVDMLTELLDPDDVDD